jgi:hypothetical protein
MSEITDKTDELFMAASRSDDDSATRRISRSFPATRSGLTTFYGAT